MVSAFQARGRRGFDSWRFVHGRGRRRFDKRRFVHADGKASLDPLRSVQFSSVHGPWFRGFSNAVVVHVHGLRGIAVDPEPWFKG